MEYAKEINIREAVVHVLDNNSEEPILNEYVVGLDEDCYNFLYKHIKRCLYDENLKYAMFDGTNCKVKEKSQQYLNGEIGILETSKMFAKELFSIMRTKGNILSCDLITVSITTEFGPYLCILKMDYQKNYMHNIEYVDDKVGISISPHFNGLPISVSKIQKCAFIKPLQENDEYNLMVIDKKSKDKNAEEYGADYFTETFLNCSMINNERDHTRNLFKAVEKWTQNSFTENAEKQEAVLSKVVTCLKDEENIDTDKLADDLFTNTEMKESFKTFLSEYQVEKEVPVDKEWVEKKLKTVKLKVDGNINISLPEEVYEDKSKFEVISNGDGSINIIIKNILNYNQK